MNPTKAASLRLTPTERHEFVVLGVRAGKSNRAIAKELGVDEGTIRRDRKFLATPEVKRPMTVPPPKTPKKEWPVRELSPDESRRRQLQGILKVAKLWVTQEGFILPDLELFVLPRAGKLLHYHRTHRVSFLHRSRVRMNSFS